MPEIIGPGGGPPRRGGRAGKRLTAARHIKNHPPPRPMPRRGWFSERNERSTMEYDRHQIDLAPLRDIGEGGDRFVGARVAECGAEHRPAVQQ